MSERKVAAADWRILTSLSKFYLWTL
jgi:hypothetical protein